MGPGMDGVTRTIYIPNQGKRFETQPYEDFAPYAELDEVDEERKAAKEAASNKVSDTQASDTAGNIIREASAEGETVIREENVKAEETKEEKKVATEGQEEETEQYEESESEYEESETEEEDETGTEEQKVTLKEWLYITIGKIGRASCRERV